MTGSETGRAARRRGRPAAGVAAATVLAAAAGRRRRKRFDHGGQHDERKLERHSAILRDGRRRGQQLQRNRRQGRQAARSPEAVAHSTETSATGGRGLRLRAFRRRRGRTIEVQPAARIPPARAISGFTATASGFAAKAVVIQTGGRGGSSYGSGGAGGLGASSTLTNAR